VKILNVNTQCTTVTEYRQCPIEYQSVAGNAKHRWLESVYICWTANSRFCWICGTVICKWHIIWLQLPPAQCHQFRAHVEDVKKHHVSFQALWKSNLVHFHKPNTSVYLHLVWNQWPEFKDYTTELADDLAGMNSSVLKRY